MNILKNIYKKLLQAWKNLIHQFHQWISSPLVFHRVRRHRIKIFLFLCLTPILLIIPAYSLFGSISLMSYHFGSGLFLFFFSICTMVTFIGLPLVFSYILFQSFSYRNIIMYSVASIIVIISILWTFHYYGSFMPILKEAITKT